ncbi:MAG: LolA-like protein [Planctomycetota bacterium]|jgi:hypothetical protein
MIACLLGSCRSAPPGPDDAVSDVPTYAALAEAHNARVDRIKRVYADGSIELRWTDEDGEHFAPGNLDLWVEPPDRTAIFISKGGERIMWLGSNGPAAWLFDFRNDQVVLHLAQPAEGGTGGLPFDPVQLVGLCGLTPLPGTGTMEGHDKSRDAYAVVGEAPGSPMRVWLDRGTRLPVRVEILDPDGTAALYSELKLRRYDRIVAVGGTPGAGPMIPTLIDVHGIDGGAHAKLSIYSPTDDPREIEAHFFDLDWLKQSFPPHRVEGMVPLVAAP